MNGVVAAKVPRSAAGGHVGKGWDDYSTIPAGEFEVLNFKGTVTTPQQISGTKNPRYLDNLYSNNVGKVLQTYFYLLSPIISEKRLVRYNINKD